MKRFQFLIIVLISLSLVKSETANTTDVKNATEAKKEEEPPYGGMVHFANFPILQMPVVEGRKDNYDIVGSRIIAWIFVFAAFVGACYNFLYYIPQQLHRQCYQYHKEPTFDLKIAEEYDIAEYHEITYTRILKSLGDTDIYNERQIFLTHLALNSAVTDFDDASDIFLFEVVLSEYLHRIQKVELVNYYYDQETKQYKLLDKDKDDDEKKVELQRIIKKVSHFQTTLVLARMTCAMCLATQFLAVLLVFINLIENRMLMVFGPTQIFLRGFFCICIMISFSHDVVSINLQEAAIWRGIYSYKMTIWNMLMSNLRLYTGWFTLFVILIFVISTDQEEQESDLDQAMNFTALLILFQLDEMLVGALFNKFITSKDKEQAGDEDDWTQETITHTAANVRDLFASRCNLVTGLWKFRTLLAWTMMGSQLILFWFVGVFFYTNTDPIKA